ncbi:glycosyltransferase family 2 protein [Pirellulaceae bacterium SH501]
MISVLILTKNEEQNLPHLFAKLKWCDDIVVLDSYSTDNTVSIAESEGASVFFRQFDNELSQRQASLKLPFKYDWVYNPDADEVPDDDLIREMLFVIQNTEHSAFRVRFKNMFMNRWIRFSSIYPTWVMRLFKPHEVILSREINLEYSTLGTEGVLTSHFLHYSFRKGLHDWFDKHNRYSSKEAAETIRSLTYGKPDLLGLFAIGDPVRQRRSLKELSFRLPFRPALRFLYMYVFRLGFLDGVAGFHYCLLLSFYEYMITLKVRELRCQNGG